MITRAMTAIVLTLAFCLAPLVDAAPYRPPNLETKLFDADKVDLGKFDYSATVNGLLWIGRDFDDEDDVDFELRAHALGIAARLDPDNENIESALDQLKDLGRAVGDETDRSDTSNRLYKGVRSLVRKKDNKANQACAAYIVDISLRFDPDGKYADKLKEYQEELKDAGHEADWKDTLGRPIRHQGGMFEEEEVVFEKKEVEMPGGKGERFAQPQSRVNGLVVRQLGSGNLAGSASTVNATALREDDVDDLLFTFNQDVGPMMGGSLEEVIKFLRIRYDSKPEKIPSGYKIELGFQDKYVPKDGPSAATAFTLLLDSLFSGEQLDDDFACTGDMTADGRVQRIGGAAAKIRGATKRGCKIVGIPIDNGKEINDVLLLDGIDQLLDIQIFTLETFKEAYTVSRKEKDEDTVETLRMFNQVAEVVRERGEEALENEKVQTRLQQVLDRMPNHLSAKLLLEKGKDDHSKVLTVGGTLNQIEITVSGTLRNIGRAILKSKINGDDGDDFGFDKETAKDAKEAVDELEKLSDAIDPRLEKYHGSVLTVIKSVADGAKGGEDSGDYADRIERELDSVQSTYRKLIQDPEILEDMGG